jgi:hypothetical protein
MQRTIRLVPALVLAALVVVVSVAGSATAAKLVTGKQIKNGTITSVDVRNGTLSGADVRSGSIGRGDLAPTARTEVRASTGTDQNIDTCTDTSLEECSSLAATVLPVGTWVVSGHVVVDNFDGPATALSNRCGLYRDGLVLGDARTPLAANGTAGEAESIALSRVVTVTGSPLAVGVRCTEMNGENLRVNGPTVTAVRVG